MTIMLFLSYLAAVVLAVVLIVLVVRLVRSIGGGRRKWVERSGEDRRKRHIPVARERRKKLRRQEDIARQFLNRVGD